MGGVDQLGVVVITVEAVTRDNRRSHLRDVLT